MKTNSQLVLSLALLAVVVVQSQAAVINATADVADGWYDVAGAVNTGARLMAGPLDDVPDASRNGMAVFQLPNIPAGDTVVSAELSLNLHQVNLIAIDGVGMGIDVYAMRVSNSSAYGVADYFSGAFPGIGNSAGGGTGIQDNLMVFNDDVPPFQPELGVYTTGAAANAALGAYLQSNAYSSLTGTPSSTYILLRVNHDSAPANKDFQLARFNDTEMSSGSFPIPVLKLTTAPGVPEPTSIVLGVVAVAVLVSRRICSSRCST